MSVFEKDIVVGITCRFLRKLLRVMDFGVETLGALLEPGVSLGICAIVSGASERGARLTAVL